MALGEAWRALDALARDSGCLSRESRFRLPDVSREALLVAERLLEALALTVRERDRRLESSEDVELDEVDEERGRGDEETVRCVVSPSGRLYC